MSKTKHDLWLLAKWVSFGTIVCTILLYVVGASTIEAFVLAFSLFAFAGFFLWFFIRPACDD